MEQRRLAKGKPELPTARQAEPGEGFPPDADNRYGELLINFWHEQSLELDRKWKAEGAGARFRHSSAGDCSRAIAYAALDIPKDSPMEPADHFITRQGQQIHDEWQRLVKEAFPGAQIEVTVSGTDGTGHIDVVDHVTEGGQTYLDAVEGKTVDGFSYKKAMGIPPASRIPQGPTYKHKAQAFVNGRRLDADRVRIVLWSRGAISHQMAQAFHVPMVNRVTAQWTYTREQYEPIADAELARIARILALLDEGTLPGRRIPDPELPQDHLITNPRKGEWIERDAEGRPLNAGKTWQCGYCPWQQTCATTAPGRQPVSVLFPGAETLVGIKGDTDAEQ